MKTHSLCLVVASMAVSLTAFGAENPMKPGLWEVSTKIVSGGKEFDPQAEMKKAMAKMSPEQRKQMAAMMAKSGVSTGAPGEGGTRICYTQEMLSGKNFGADSERHCETTIKEQTKKHMKMDFKCEDGATGTGEWNFPSSTSYTAKMKFTRKTGEVSDIAMNGRFVRADCGDVKPFPLPSK